MQASCLVLFSGGLDSILACRILQEAGIRVTALKFITPFFGSSALGREGAVEEEMSRKYGFDCRVVDISEDYLRMVAAPPHGYGKHMNPCIDCKILMVKKALGLMGEMGASFVATGEVPGQRPMSQRSDTLRIIERESGADGFLLRPLAASLFKPVIAEEQGLFSSSDFPVITGRGRKEQMKLAASLGIRDYPSPAGGCVLADPILGSRFKKLFFIHPSPSVNDILLARTGRHFILPDGAWLILGRNRHDNERLRDLALPGDLILRVQGVPGPFSIMRNMDGNVASGDDCRLASRIIMRYVNKRGEGGIAVQVARMDEDMACSPVHDLDVYEAATDEKIERLSF